jgi:hypothetical protein
MNFGQLIRDLPKVASGTRWAGIVALLLSLSSGALERRFPRMTE